MKRILILLLCYMVLDIGICNAEIFNGKDDFTGGKIIGSHSKCDFSMKNTLDQMSFYKVLNLNTVEYKLVAYVSASKDFSLSSSKVEMNIDGNATYALDVTNRIEGTYSTTVNYKVKEEVTKQLLQANRIALRFTRVNGSTFVYVLPDNVLAEWKQVINMEK